MNTKTYASRIHELAHTPVSKAELAKFKARSIPASIDPLAMFPEMKASHAAQFVGQLKIGKRKPLRVLSLEDASCQYQQLRDDSGRGASTFPEGELTISNNVYRISYNGRVWANLEWKSGDTPVYCPSVGTVSA